MSTTDQLGELSTSLAARGKAILGIAKELTGISTDPFMAKDQLNSVADRAQKAGIQLNKDLDSILEEVEGLCTRAHAEFWDNFTRGCQQRGWALSGTTTRRLLCQGIFLELKPNKLIVEELQIHVTPFVPSLMELLSPHVADLVPPGHTPQSFLDMLARAYDALAGPTEKSLEEVFKMFVSLSQKPVFWKAVNPATFTRITRPAFRARIAMALASGLKCSDGRELKFGTTLSASDMWEIYSPGEERSVQIGRISFSGRN